MFGFLKSIKFIAILLAIIGILLVFIILNNPFEEPAIKVDLSRDSIVKEMQSLGRLETASYSIEKIIEAGKEGNVIQDLLYGDRILLIANGKVVAGIDLLNLKEEDVVVDGENLTINLPAPIIISSNLDNSKTKVYDRDQGYLNRGDKDLETEARRSAEAAIREAACGAGILEEARTNAIERIRELFKLAGFTNITVNIPTGSC